MREDLFTHHPPERGRQTRRSMVVYACSSTCCCLHSVGAFLGALVGGGLKRPSDDPGFDKDQRIPGVHWLFDRWPRTQWVFWTSLFALAVFSFPLILLKQWFDNNFIAGDLLTLPALLLLYGPVYVFGAWFLSLFRLRMLPARSVASREYWALHRTLVGALVGTLLGWLLLWLLGQFIVIENDTIKFQ